MSTTDVSDYQDFQDRLLPGEAVAWAGRPRGGLLLTTRDIFLIPFSLLWCGFAIFWESSVFTTNAPFFFRLWGIPFVLIGLHFVVGRFFADAWIRLRLRYAITNQRVLILRKGIATKFTAISLDKLPALSLSEKSNGRGTIRFGETVSPWANRNGFGVWMPSSDPTPQFLNIENVRQVFDQIQSLASSKTRASQ